VKRREFIAGLGSAAAWPVAARAQQPDRMRRIGVLMGWSEREPTVRSWLDAFEHEMALFGWVDGRNLHIERRWTEGDSQRARTLAMELVAQRPDAILAGTTPVTAALQRETRTIPIVFGIVSDPVGAGFAASLSRPGGNITGFINVEEAMGGKWLALLKEIAPRIKRAAIMFNPETAPGHGDYFIPSFERAAGILAIETVTKPVRSLTEIETVISALGREQAGLVLMTDSFLAVHHQRIILLTASNKVPAIFEPAYYAKNGGLMAYGANGLDIFRRTANYMDRVLRGANPADLPIEVPVKFELAVNLKTANALGLTVPNTLLVTADEVIE
jgi:putative ABC transport system substrate-binding protein